MAIDVYFQINGIKGKSQDLAQQGWIEISSAHWGVWYSPEARPPTLVVAIPPNAASTIRISKDACAPGIVNPRRRVMEVTRVA